MFLNNPLKINVPKRQPQGGNTLVPLTIDLHLSNFQEFEAYDV